MLKKEKQLYLVTLPDSLPVEPKRRKWKISAYSPAQALAAALIMEGYEGSSLRLAYSAIKDRAGELVKQIGKGQASDHQMRLF